MHRIRIFQSSSTKLAVLLSSLLVGSLFLLSIEIYRFSHGKPIQPIIIHSILGVVLFICCSLFFISYYATKRINAIVETADSIIRTGDLTQRIPIDNPWDDLSKLAQVLNAMLAQIDQSVASIRQVSDNIAHDLRTPLTRLRNHIENMRMSAIVPPTDPEEQQKEFNALVTECDALLSTFNALLRIANIESGRGHSLFERTNLMPVVEDAIDLYEPMASEKNIRLSFHAEPAWVQGDKDLIFQMLANLLDNAIKHTPVGGDITLAIKAGNPKTTITITDTGTGIPDEHKHHVFRRFYRTESARNTPGSGLGLSLVNAIIRLHKGTIKLQDRTPNGLIVTIVL